VSTTDVATPRMISLIGSLADNKSALGRRYGEWAVSAPTIESAVAAAAMAQDELGHARATYPVLAKLGAARDEEGLDAGHPMPVIAAELPDWASLVAANAVVDGILTTFVAATRESSIEPLAQRARKILQEEGSHRVHAEAWCRRIARAGGSDLELLLARIDEMWAHAARWPGSDEDAGLRQAIATGMVGEGAAAIRARVRAWLTGLLAEAGVSVALPEPGFGGPPECPFCGSPETELVSPWGGQMITSQQRCRGCGTYFEAVRADFDLSR
jgi:1,2-phenylacetyl-CoA epoxidase catalytic subunit